MLDVGDNKSVIHAIVMRLLEPLKRAGHHIYMDNYYTSLSLFIDMKQKGFGACGTARVDRKGMPLEWKGKGKGQTGDKRKGLKKGEVRTENLENGVLTLQWKDKRLITMLSTVHDSSMVTKTRRTRLSSTGRENVEK